jgi:uncharacterized protein (DUF2147 family)
MFNRKLLPAISAAVLLATPALAQPASPAGTWETEGGWATVRIASCPGQPERLCGWITQLKEPNDPKGRPKRDTANTDPKLRGRAIVGMPFITGFKAAGPKRWTGGTIYNPGDGKTYASNLTLSPNGTLRVKGCVLVICQAQVWTRVPT